jgi:catechol 2,3-dioxygenase-like lactoylglutathione lyase family enzyme
MSIKILSVDHIGFNVSDPERSLQFYAGTLGLQPLRFDEFRAGKVPFPSVRVNAETILDFFPPEYHRETPGGRNVNHVALTLADTPAQIEAFLKERGIEIVLEMTGNFGAQGDNAHAFHVLDPDGNMLELHAYEFRPRRGRTPMGRYLWLARVFDKARASAGRTIGEYIYPCPIDQGVMQRWGITPSDFDAAVAGNNDDASILRWAQLTISDEAADAANSWVCVEKVENLDRQDLEEGALAALAG